MSDIEVNDYSFRDLRYFRVYCRFCGRQNTFWDKVKHPAWCKFKEAFRSELEARRAAGWRESSERLEAPRPCGSW